MISHVTPSLHLKTCPSLREEARNPSPYGGLDHLEANQKTTRVFFLLVVKLKNPEVTERRPIDMSSNPTITVDIVGDDHQVLQFFVLVL